MRIFQDTPLNDPIKLFTSRPIHIERPYCPISICSTTNRDVTITSFDAVWSRCTLGHRVPLVHHLVFIYPFYGFTCWFWKSKLMIPILNIQNFKYLQYHTENNSIYKNINILEKQEFHLIRTPYFQKFLKMFRAPTNHIPKCFIPPPGNPGNVSYPGY